MAMLAEPRRYRKRYNIVPRGKALFEDDNRFGTKILGRMGWTKGKGLGAREDGSQEFVRVRYKNDFNGVGYEDREDQWTEHMEQFNGLLNSLNNSEANSEAEEEKTARVGFGFMSTKKVKKNMNVKDKISGESLEEKSKQSKSRVHYKKFTRGKDLSQYSEIDLASIFGKKTDETGIFQKSEPIIIDAKEKDEESDENTDSNKKFGITTINTGTSVNDYFKQKMDEIKKKRMIGTSKNPFHTTEKHDCHVEVVDKLKKKSEKPKGIQELEPEENFCDNISVKKTEICKKKKRKHVEISGLSVEPLEEISMVKSKNKKRKQEIFNNEELSLENLHNHSIENLEKNLMEKPEKKKRLKIYVSNEELAVANLKETSIARLKKKKHNTEIAANNEEVVNTEEFEILVNKKRRVKNTDSDIQINEKTEIRKFVKPEKKNKKCILPSAELSADLKITEDTKFKNTLKSTTDPYSPENSVSAQTTNSVYKITHFCAEKFRHTDLYKFPGSNLVEIVGYGIEKDFKLEIVHSTNDMENIKNLWTQVYDNSLTDKYKLYGNCPLKKYAIKVKNARRNNLKIPKINIKRFKNKSIFKSI